MKRLIVTIDGPAGSGKSTVARELATRLGVEFLDTGAMYRGVTAACVDRGIEPARDQDAAIATARSIEMHFDWQDDPPRLLIDGVDVTDRLRDRDVTGRVSDLSAIGEIRKVLVAMQQSIGQAHPRLVTEGRDQGSVVFPDATVKFYLDANPRVRAVRRTRQLRELGKEANEDEIYDQLIARDEKDRQRADGPLKCAEDARRIDTSEMTLAEVVDLLEEIVRVEAPNALDASKAV